ncbi:MAG TPA: hypothetical protein VG942_03985 [Hyphomonadaceae bacterium]|nr:hypothetical protein [Hyphomonadaceae bacterium]
MRSEKLLCAAALTIALAVPALAQAPAPADRLLPSTAAAYAQYQGEVSNIMAKPMANAADVDKALNTFGSPNPDQLSSAWISYSAIVAAQNKDFADAVRDIDSYYGRDRVMTGMRNDVGYARTLKGGEKALQDALVVNAKDSSRISAAGAFVREQAGKLNTIAWGKSRVKDPQANAVKLKTDALLVRPVTDAAKKLFTGPDLNTMLASVSPQSDKSIWDKISVFTASAPATALSTLSPVVVAQPTMKVDPKHVGTANRIVTLAAFHVIEAEKSNQDDVKAAMSDKTTTGCIDWAQMQLQACVSAAFTRSEISYCLARHGLQLAGETQPSIGACFSDLAK